MIIARTTLDPKKVGKINIHQLTWHYDDSDTTIRRKLDDFIYEPLAYKQGLAIPVRLRLTSVKTKLTDLLSGPYYDHKQFIVSARLLEIFRQFPGLAFEIIPLEIFNREGTLLEEPYFLLSYTSSLNSTLIDLERMVFDGPTPEKMREQGYDVVDVFLYGKIGFSLQHIHFSVPHTSLPHHFAVRGTRLRFISQAMYEAMRAHDISGFEFYKFHEKAFLNTSNPLEFQQNIKLA